MTSRAGSRCIQSACKATVHSAAARHADGRRAAQGVMRGVAFGSRPGHPGAGSPAWPRFRPVRQVGAGCAAGAAPSGGKGAPLQGQRERSNPWAVLCQRQHALRGARALPRAASCELSCASASEQKPHPAGVLPPSGCRLGTEMLPSMEHGASVVGSGKSLLQQTRLDPVDRALLCAGQAVALWQDRPDQPDRLGDLLAGWSYTCCS